MIIEPTWNRFLKSHCRENLGSLISICQIIIANRKIHNEGHVRKVWCRDIRETPHIARHQKNPVIRRVREKRMRERRGGGGIYDVSKTFIRRSLTPIVAFHAVRVCRYQNYIVVKLTSRSPSPVRRPHPPSLRQCCYGGKRGITSRERVSTQHTDVLRRILASRLSRSPPPSSSRA